MPYIDSLPEGTRVRDLYQIYPAVYQPWKEMGKVIMDDPSPFSRGEREFLAAYVSALNSCEYCYGIHAAIATTWNIDEGLLSSLTEDLATAPIEEKWRVLLRFIKKLTEQSSRITRRDVQGVLDAGWDEETFHYAVLVCCRFNFMNRLVDAFGLEPYTPAEAKERSEKLVTEGYDRKVQSGQDGSSADK